MVLGIGDYSQRKYTYDEQGQLLAAGVEGTWKTPAGLTVGRPYLSLLGLSIPTYSCPGFCSWNCVLSVIGSMIPRSSTGFIEASTSGLRDNGT